MENDIEVGSCPVKNSNEVYKKLVYTLQRRSLAFDVFNNKAFRLMKYGLELKL
jgi:hypothetical protein